MTPRTALLFLLPFSLALLLGSVEAQLQIGFYSKTCPNVEDIVRKEMTRALSVAPSLAGPLLRMHFHDCFVRGCDASILLDSTKSNVAEKDAPPNQTLRGFGFIERVKAEVEKACPGTVSCADILALTARDAVWLSKGPTWPVQLGRRDGRISRTKETNQLPPPKASISRLITKFSAKGLSIKDLVVLSGGHTIGTSHCSSFSDRLYNFTGKNSVNDVDPALDLHYISRLRTRCSLTDNTTIVEMDPGSFKTFDVHYYTNVAKRRGLFHSDASLLGNSFTKAYVERHAAAGFESEFYQDFAVSMAKMGNVGVLTGSQGEIRSKCYVVN